MSRQELIGWLQQQIVEQKRIDASTSGVPLHPDNPQAPSIGKDIAVMSDVQLLLPIDAKKQRKHVKQLFMDRGKL